MCHSSLTLCFWHTTIIFIVQKAVFASAANYTESSAWTSRVKVWITTFSGSAWRATAFIDLIGSTDGAWLAKTHFSLGSHGVHTQPRSEEASRKQPFWPLARFCDSLKHPTNLILVGFMQTKLNRQSNTNKYLETNMSKLVDYVSITKYRHSSKTQFSR